MASMSGAPGWRPSYKYYNPWVSLGGAIICLAIMFLVSWIASLITLTVAAALYMYLQWKPGPRPEWGSAGQAQLYSLALKTSHRLQKETMHVKNYRPQYLVLMKSVAEDLPLLFFVDCLQKGGGCIVCGSVITSKSVTTGDINRFKIGERAKIIENNEEVLKAAEISAFQEVTMANDVRSGCRSLMQLAGLGGLRPNVVVVAFNERWNLRKGDDADDGVNQKAKAAETGEGAGVAGRRSDWRVTAYVGMLRDAFDLNLGVLMMRNADKLMNLEEYVAQAREYKEKSAEHVSDERRAMFYYNRNDDDDDDDDDDKDGVEKDDDGDGGGDEEAAKQASKGKKSSHHHKKKLGKSRLADQQSSGASSSHSSSLSSSKKSSAKLEELASETVDHSLAAAGHTTSKWHKKSAVASTEVAMDMMPQMLRGIKSTKYEGTVDVYWLVDDGGLTILLPYLLLQNSRWSKCKMRLFSLPKNRSGSDKVLEKEQLRLSQLMHRFRIDADVEIIGTGYQEPSEESMRQFESLLPDDVKRTLSDKTLARSKGYVRLAECMREQSKDAPLVFMSLPVPSSAVRDEIYMAWLETLSGSVQSCVLLRGTSENVVSMYS